ncbi:MAG TPA: antitoxin family protein [Chloroflexia bacterium]|nr:antitoxin family protein [Chloroflexia bacterium]
METIRAVYEGGVFRPVGPVELPEGAWVEVNPIGQNGAQPVEQGQSQRKAIKSLVGEELTALLDQFDALPYTPHTDGRTDISEKHDEILYPKHGDMP